MGSVYRATHLLLEQTVALKVLLPSLTANPTSARRFVREAKGTFRLDHPHCVRVSDFGATEDGILYLVMEYLDGRTVARELRIDGPIDASRTAHILGQCARALHHAHGLGLIHRDIKSENIMLLSRDEDPDFVKVLDFGLAKLWDPDGGGLATIMSVAALTQKGMTFGTPDYMSPEQALGARLGPSTDVYSLGVLGYEMLTGTLPFRGKTVVELLASIARDSPVPPSRLRPGSIPPSLEALLLACMAKDPNQRPPSARAVADELEQSSTSTTPRPSALAASETLELPASPQTSPVPGASRPAQAATSARPLDTRAVVAAAGIGRRRPSVVLIGALAALVLAAAIVATAVHQSARAPKSAAAAPSPIDAGLSPTRPDARVVAAAEIIDAAAAPPIDAGALVAKHPTPTRIRTPSPSQRRAAALVAEAKAASTTLARMAKADAALRLDPGNLEAHYLFGDALIAAGKRERGCQHLRQARALRAARTRLSEAGCEGGSD